MTTPPLVSVVTPVYNGAAYLSECIESVRRQTLPSWELVILNNCSTDATERIASDAAAADPRIRAIHAREFVGIYANHNRAVRQISADSRYVKILHADDWLYPECLERMVAVAGANPRVGVVSAFCIEGAEVRHDGLVPLEAATMDGPEVVRRALLGPPWVTGSPSSLLYRADLVRASGEFFEESLWHADTDTAYRVLCEWDLGFVHQVLTYTRLHDGAITPKSHRINTYLPQDLRMVLRYGRRVLDADAYRRVVRRWLSAYAWYLAKQAAKPRRWVDAEFHRFHRREIELLIRDAEHDHSAAAVLRGCALLLRSAPRAARMGGAATPAQAPTST